MDCERLDIGDQVQTQFRNQDVIVVHVLYIAHEQHLADDLLSTDS